MKIVPISPGRDDVSELLRQATEYVASLYSIESNHLDDAAELSGSNVHFVGAFFHEILIGIGAVKSPLDDQKYGEIKSMFVVPDFRGKGVARLIMNELEGHLLKRGISLSKLETGIYQPEAIGLYEQLGYTACNPFGGYHYDPLSVFMEKRLHA